MSAPIQLYGPYYGRRHRLAVRALHALRTLAIAACVVVGMPLLAGIAYGAYLLATGG